MTCCTPFPSSVFDLYHVRQKEGEKMRHFVWRFREVADGIPANDLPEPRTVLIFHMNVRSVTMRVKLCTQRIATLDELWALADRCSCAEEAADFPMCKVL